MFVYLLLAEHGGEPGIGLGVVFKYGFGFFAHDGDFGGVVVLVEHGGGVDADAFGGANRAEAVFKHPGVAGIAADGFAGKLDESKGGMLLAELMNRRLDTAREIVYLIIGNATGEYGERVEARMAESPYRVLRFPTQKYSQLARFYQAADAGLIAKQASLNFFDMEACGVPVLTTLHAATGCEVCLRTGIEDLLAEGIFERRALG